MNKPLQLFLLLLLISAGCRTPGTLPLETGELEEAAISPEELTALVPDYSDRLQTLSGEGRAWVSSPEGSDQVGVRFISDRESSLVSLRNRLGMEGGELLVKNDSLLVYNRVEGTAEKVSLRDPRLTGSWAIATTNLIELFHRPLPGQEIVRILQDSRHYVVDLRDGSRVVLEKSSGRIVEITGGLRDPWGRIHYEGWEVLDGFQMPRRITIFTRDRETRVILLVRQLEVNRPIPEPDIDLPENIPVQTL